MSWLPWIALIAFAAAGAGLGVSMAISEPRERREMSRLAAWSDEIAESSPRRHG